MSQDASLYLHQKLRKAVNCTANEPSGSGFLRSIMLWQLTYTALDLSFPTWVDIEQEGDQINCMLVQSYNPFTLHSGAGQGNSLRIWKIQGNV